MKQQSKWPQRLVIYFVGLVCVAFGVACAVKSELGISSISSLPYAAYRALLQHGVEGLSYGMCITFSHLLLMLVQFCVLRRAYQLKNLLQVVVSTLFGQLVDVAAIVVGPAHAMPYVARLGFLALAILLLALGISLYVGMNIMPMPGDGLSVVLSQVRNKIPFHKMRRNIDCIMVALAVVIGLIGTGQVVGVREGTVLYALLLGPAMGLIKPWLAPLLCKVQPAA